MERKITVCRAKWDRYVPHIEFGGQYLAKHGFNPGDQVRVVISDKKIELIWDKESQWETPNVRPKYR